MCTDFLNTFSTVYFSTGVCRQQLPLQPALQEVRMQTAQAGRLPRRLHPPVFCSALPRSGRPLRLRRTVRLHRSLLLGRLPLLSGLGPVLQELLQPRKARRLQPSLPLLHSHRRSHAHRASPQHSLLSRSDSFQCPKLHQPAFWQDY